jgi:nucleotide-binding universal stress UspA family protein
MSPIRMKRILVPMDFSDTSEKAFSYAAEIARAFGAEIVLLHVVDTRVVDNVFHIHSMPPEDARAQMRKSAEEAVARIVGLEESAGLTISAIYAEGIPPVEVKQAAEEVNADLIAMGTHGTTGIAHLLYGSTADGVLRGAPCPVLTVNP